MLEVLLRHELGELSTELVMQMLGKESQSSVTTTIGLENEVDLDEEKLLFLAGGQPNTFDDEVDEGPIQDMAQKEDNIFQANQYKAGPSYDSDTLSEVQGHDNCLDNMNESHEEHEMHNEVKPDDIVDSDTEYTSNSKIISYEQYVQDNKDQVVHSDESFIPNDAVIIISNDVYDQDVLCVTFNKPKNTINASITAELARYKELAKAKALKEKAKSAKPIASMMVYPPTTPPKLVLKVLPTKSQGIQKALIYEIKEMKEVFDQMEVEVDQNAVDKKCDEIERNNLLIENENLIAKCLSKDVFYTATDSMLTVSRFSDMHDAYTVAQKRIAELEAENSNLTQKIKKDDHD
nr:integrase, catalytic region, zinc finger, CCHC-type, peptidase aspartic, catalytic [Tanacetum cinerariifolium]